MSEWNEHRLGEVCSRLSSGSNITAKDIHESGSFPVFGGNGIRGFADEANFSGECAIIGRQGAYCGNVRYFIGEARMSEHAVVACAGPSHNTRFLAYLLSHMNLGKLSGQAAQPGLSVKVLSQQTVRMPSRQHQERIAEILGAYDDLIEVNRRRIAVLEEMARGLFEDWFVRFRFPGHEAVPILDTPDGPLPEGWRWDRIGDVTAYVNRGMAPKYDDDAKTLVIGQKCIRDYRLSLVLARKQSKKVPVEKVVQPGDILINSTGTGTLGRVAQAEQVPLELTVDSHVTIVRPILPEDRDYLGLSLFAMQPIFEHLGAGSTNQTELARSAVQNQMLAWPPIDLRAQFGRIVRPMRELVEQLTQQNASLAASRDLLLPRLISGQLSVTEAERALEEAA